MDPSILDVPKLAFSCSGAPEMADVLVLAGLLALRTLSERLFSARH